MIGDRQKLKYQKYVISVICCWPAATRLDQQQRLTGTKEKAFIVASLLSTPTATTTSVTTTPLLNKARLQIVVNSVKMCTGARSKDEWK